MAAYVVSVNVGIPRTVIWMGRTETTAIWKTPLAGRVPVRGVNVDGDGQADHRAHGGPDKAVYAYAREDQEWWEAALRRAVEPGAFGENLTLAGVDVTGAVIGARWEIGTVLFVFRSRAGPAPICASSARATWVRATRSASFSVPTTASRPALLRASTSATAQTPTISFGHRNSRRSGMSGREKNSRRPARKPQREPTREIGRATRLNSSHLKLSRMPSSA